MIIFNVMALKVGTKGCEKPGKDNYVYLVYQCGPGLIPARCHMWVEFVVGFHPCSVGFSPGSPLFVPPEISNIPNSNLIWIKDPYENQLELMWLPLIYLFVSLLSESPLLR